MKAEKNKKENYVVSQNINTIDFPTDLSNNNDIDNNDKIRQIAIECLRKSDISGNPEKIANEYIKIYNMLKNNVNNFKKQEIPEQTVFDDYIICLEDGRRLQMLNRHLKVYYNMTFQEYKQKWGLPIDYPCTCKNYSKIRAEIAGRRKKKK